MYAYTNVINGFVNVLIVNNIDCYVRFIKDYLFMFYILGVCFGILLG